MDRITPFLWFDRQALEAAKFYVSVFQGDSRIKSVQRYGASGPGPKGSVMTVEFRIRGTDFVALNGGPDHKFNPAVSFVVYCETQREIDSMWRKLAKGGREVACGWLTDRYGLSWQIVPKRIMRLLDGKDLERKDRVMRAVLGMVKLDLAALAAAYAGRPPRAPTSGRRSRRK